MCDEKKAIDEMSDVNRLKYECEQKKNRTNK